MYLLDTNHCSQLLENNPTVVQKLSDLGDVIVATCVIVQGELVFGASISEHRETNLERVKEFLDNINVYRVDQETADIYGNMKAAVFNHFGPKEKTKRRKFAKKGLGIGENDLWIAAIAKRNGLIVVSSDGDFDRIREVEDLSIEKWWLPSS
ncbi:MAG TPA: type II toxin-antitoxin system VapC family toxin [Thermodesulfobacteriota bacterium]|nr:type II toxin-antitoxin system VapC family toxin [Thermodesulfobacteriota bacterium]